MKTHDTKPPAPPVGELRLARSSGEDGYVLAQLAIGDTELHVEFVEVEVNASGKVVGYVSDRCAERVSAILHLNDNYDPQPLQWAGRHWLVLTDPVGR